MPQEYTRQRQGRDFNKHSNGAVKDETEKKSFLDRLEQYKAEAERNKIPVDGHEPPEKGRYPR